MVGPNLGLDIRDYIEEKMWLESVLWVVKFSSQ